MGIKPSYIKNLGTALLAKQREYFTNNFDENKRQTGSVGNYRKQACPEPRRRLHHKKNKCKKTHIIPIPVHGSTYPARYRGTGHTRALFEGSCIRTQAFPCSIGIKTWTGK